MPTSWVDFKGLKAEAHHEPIFELYGFEPIPKREELLPALEAAGVSFDKRAITYCNAGVSASFGLLALRLIGHPAAANFAGSWYAWEHNPQNPTETG